MQNYDIDINSNANKNFYSLVFNISFEMYIIVLIFLRFKVVIENKGSLRKLDKDTRHKRKSFIYSMYRITKE